jgi:competence ComEA-like helix-hairpin-helix protein
VPDPAPARGLVCAALAVAALRGLAVPATPPALEPVAIADGCRLAPRASGPACACDAVPGELRALLGWPIALAHASAQDLEALPGIGPRRAAAIVREREVGGPFERAADLARVAGLGPATAARLAPLVVARGSGCPAR